MAIVNSYVSLPEGISSVWVESLAPKAAGEGAEVWLVVSAWDDGRDNNKWWGYELIFKGWGFLQISTSTTYSRNYVYIYMYIHIHTCIHACIHYITLHYITYIHTSIHPYTYTYTYTYTYITIYCIFRSIGFHCLRVCSNFWPTWWRLRRVDHYCRHGIPTCDHSASGAVPCGQGGFTS